MGASLGLGSMSGQRSDSVTNATPTTVSLANDKVVNSKGVFGGILGGYLFRFQDFGVGPEVFYNYGNIENTVSGKHVDPAGVATAFDIKHRITNQTGINARFGYFLESYFVYTLFGLHSQTGNYQVKARQDAGAGNMLEYSYNTGNKITTGSSFGLGVQKQITENYEIGLEYKLTNFPRKNPYEFNTKDPIKTTLTSTLSYKLHSIGLRCIYKF